jgi:hypothetical protein
VLPTKAGLPAHGHTIRTNPRYLILVDLRKRVWSKLGWDKDGLGKDPWSGRLDHHEMAQTQNAELEVGSEPADVPRPDSMDQIQQVMETRVQVLQQWRQGVFGMEMHWIWCSGMNGMSLPKGSSRPRYINPHSCARPQPH